MADTIEELVEELMEEHGDTREQVYARLFELFGDFMREILKEK